MTSSSHANDPRWGNRIPWYLRHPGLTVSGTIDSWLELVGQRVETLFDFNELGALNQPHFGSRLDAETLGRFKFTWGPPLGSQLKTYFAPDTVRQQAQSDALSDPEELRARELNWKQGRRPAAAPSSVPDLNMEALRADVDARRTRAARTQRHWASRVAERVSSLEALLRLTGTLAPYPSEAVTGFVTDLRRICAATHVALNIRGSPPLIYPLDEPLLQQEVIEPLLDRLAARWPERARELVTAYHDVVAGVPLDEVFSSAFKSVEEIARNLTGDPGFDFSDADLNRHFPALHPTIKAGIAKLRAHRGDSAAHGRKAPPPSEIRFLLFQICNLGLLLLDTQPSD